MSDIGTHFVGDDCPGRHADVIAPLDANGEPMVAIRIWNLPIVAAPFARELLDLAKEHPDGKLEDVDGVVVFFYVPKGDGTPGS